MTNKERLGNCHRSVKTGETWQYKALRYPGLDPGTEKGPRGKSWWTANPAWALLSNRVPMRFLSFNKCTIWACKVQILQETGWWCTESLSFLLFCKSGIFHPKKFIWNEDLCLYSNLTHKKHGTAILRWVCHQNMGVVKTTAEAKPDGTGKVPINTIITRHIDQASPPYQSSDRHVR